MFCQFPTERLPKKKKQKLIDNKYSPYEGREKILAVHISQTCMQFSLFLNIKKIIDEHIQNNVERLIIVKQGNTKLIFSVAILYN